MHYPKLLLPIIIISQFCCTSLWFAGNGIMTDLIVAFGLNPSDVGPLTSAVQFGFILGTLSFALLTIADRFSPSKVFFISAVLAALFNSGMVLEGNNLTSLLALRFGTGFFLAGIYPVGMKIAADYYTNGLGKSLGFLVGALVLGTAFPHLLNQLTGQYPYQAVVIVTSTLAFVGGGLMISLVPDGPNRKPSQKTNLRAFFTVFKKPGFRSAAFGYFGHMWELYAFWTFVPMILEKYNAAHPQAQFTIPVWSFFIIGIGGLACVLSGLLSQRTGTQRTAFIALSLSALCCLLSPWVFTSSVAVVFSGFLLFWGMVVIADSPLLSTLVAQQADPALKGTALTIVNCIGFEITILSIQGLTFLVEYTTSNLVFMLLAIGPLLGLLALRTSTKQHS